MEGVDAGARRSRSLRDGGAAPTLSLLPLRSLLGCGTVEKPSSLSNHLEAQRTQIVRMVATGPWQPRQRAPFSSGKLGHVGTTYGGMPELLQVEVVMLTRAEMPPRTWPPAPSFLISLSSFLSCFPYFVKVSGYVTSAPGS